MPPIVPAALGLVFLVFGLHNTGTLRWGADLPTDLAPAAGCIYAIFGPGFATVGAGLLLWAVILAAQGPPDGWWGVTV